MSPGTARGISLSLNSVRRHPKPDLDMSMQTPRHSAWAFVHHRTCHEAPDPSCRNREVALALRLEILTVTRATVGTALSLGRTLSTPLHLRLYRLCRPFSRSADWSRPGRKTRRLGTQAFRPTKWFAARLPPLSTRELWQSTHLLSPMSRVLLESRHLRWKTRFHHHQARCLCSTSSTLTAVMSLSVDEAGGCRYSATRNCKSIERLYKQFGSQ